MPDSIECYCTSCRVRFKPQINQLYHSQECAEKARRLKDRFRKRKIRYLLHSKEIAARVSSLSHQKGLDLESPKDPAKLPVRRTKKFRKFSYCCDTCNRRILRPARALHVYCCPQCRRTTRNKRRRLKRLQSAFLHGERSLKGCDKSERNSSQLEISKEKRAPYSCKPP